MATPLSEYVSQLAGYICYTHADKIRVIDMWRSLPAYRATVPLKVSALDARILFYQHRNCSRGFWTAAACVVCELESLGFEAARLSAFRPPFPQTLLLGC